MLATVLTAASLALQMHGPWPSMVIQGSPARLMRPSIRRAPTPLAAVEAMPRPVSIAPFETGSAVITNLTTHHLDAPESLAFHGVVHPVKSSPWPLVRARALLVGASALWGTYAVVLRLLYQAPGPTLSGEFVSAMRFQVLTAVALGSAVAPALRGRGRKMRFSAPLLRDSFLLAVVGFFGSFCSTVSVAHLAALPSEVLLGTVNLFVPIQTVLIGKRVGIRTWVGCGLCFLAVCTVAVFGSVSAAGAVSWPHMLMLLGSAKLYALGRVGAQWCVAHRGYEAEALNLARMIFMGLLAQVVLAVRSQPARSSLGAAPRLPTSTPQPKTRANRHLSKASSSTHYCILTGVPASRRRRARCAEPPRHVCSCRAWARSPSSRRRSSLSQRCPRPSWGRCSSTRPTASSRPRARSRFSRSKPSLRPCGHSSSWRSPSDQP